MRYWIETTLLSMGFWLTWSLIPLIVELIPAFLKAIKLLLLSLESTS